jgi:hypothetical protein
VKRPKGIPNYLLFSPPCHLSLKILPRTSHTSSQSLVSSFPCVSPFLPHPFPSSGYFDLDPNRVLDLILDTMEHQIWNLSFLLVLKQFRKTSIAHILGFKYTQFRTALPTPVVAAAAATAPPTPTSASQPETDDSVNQISTPESLYALTAILLTTELISLEQILPYFSPNFQDIKVLVTEKSSKLQEEIKAYGVVNLTKKSETKSATPSSTAAAAAPSSTSPYADGYQLVGLLAATLTVRNWTLAEELLQLIKLHTSMSPAITTSFSRPALAPASPECVSFPLLLLLLPPRHRY